MADQEVSDAMRAAVGQSPITDPHKRTGSLFDVIGNIPSDIQNLVTGFVPGTASYIASIPEQATDLAKTFVDPSARAGLAAKYGITPNNDLGDILRNLPKTPLLGPLLPGASTASAATTPAGRESLKEHPVSTAIDVGAAVATAGKLGAFGRGSLRAGAAAAEAEAEAAKLGLTKTVSESGFETFQKPGGKFASAADVAKVKGAELARQEATRQAGTAIGALQRGQPFKAAGRTTLTTVEKTPILGNVVNRRSIRNVLMDLNFHPDLVENLSRPYAVIRDKNLMKMNKFLRSDIVKPILKLSEEDRTLLAHNVTGVADDAEKAAFAGRHDLQAIEDTTRRFMDDMAELNPNISTVETPWGKKYHYSVTSVVSKRHQALQSAVDVFKRAEDVLRNKTDIRRQMEQQYGPNHQKVVTAKANEQVAINNYAEAGKNRKLAQEGFTTALESHAPASFYRVLSEKVRGKAVKLAGQQAQEGTLRYQLPEVMRRIEDATDTADLAAAIGPKEAARLMKDTEMTWTALAQMGVDPVFLPNVKATRVEHVAYPTVVPEAEYAKAHVSKSTAFNLSRTVHDVAVGVVEYERQALTEAGTREFAENWVKPWARNLNGAKNDIGKAIDNGGTMDPEARRRAIQAEVDRHYEDWNPETHGFGAYFPSTEGGTLLMPKGVVRSIKQLGTSQAWAKGAGPLHATYDKGMKVWRFAVLTTPRHLSHVLLGGAMMGILQDPFFIPHFIKNFKQVRQIIRQDDPEFIAQFSPHINFDPDSLYAIASGKTHGRLYDAATGPARNALHKVNKLEEQATLMYKITTMLTKEAKGVQREEAIRMANKWFVDMNAMTPFERNTVRMLFPFYGFTRHLFRYLMTYPADHPLAASILTNFALQHESDWNSGPNAGLPRDMKFLFFLGHPDVNGHVTGIDYRSIDPFRSFYNTFTLGGFFSQLNPAGQFIAQRAGVNVLSGTPELFPHVHYDPNTGMMVADQPPSAAMAAAEAAVPELVGVDALFAVSDQFRNLKITDPEAYKKRVFTAFGLPFAPIPVNRPEKVETTQMKRYRDASQSISEAIRTGDFSKAKRYDSVPVPSLLQPFLGNATYATPEQIQRAYEVLKSQMDKIGIQGSLHAYLPKATRTRTGH
jgi:hypothetical protein